MATGSETAADGTDGMALSFADPAADRGVEGDTPGGAWEIQHGGRTPVVDGRGARAQRVSHVGACEAGESLMEGRVDGGRSRPEVGESSRGAMPFLIALISAFWRQNAYFPASLFFSAWHLSSGVIPQEVPTPVSSESMPIASPRSTLKSQGIARGLGRHDMRTSRSLARASRASTYDYSILVSRRK